MTKEKEYKERYDRKINKRDRIVKKRASIKWIIKIALAAFIITMFFSVTSDTIISHTNIIFSVFIVIFFILIGVIFDMIGIAIASASQVPFNSMAAKKIHGAKMAIKMLQNKEKASAFCNDVIGDICGIMSGSAGIFISNNIAQNSNADLTIVTLIITSLIAALTIGGKSIGKIVAINKSELILYEVAKICSTGKNK